MTIPSSPSPHDPFDEERARRALDVANLPTLLMVLHHLTGDDRWLQDPYRPTLTRGLNDHDDGGLSPQAQQDIREAALGALRDWHDGRPIAVEAPSKDLLMRMMSTCMGEPVPEEYARLMISEMGFERVPGRPSSSHPDLSVLIIGAGVSGLTVAVALRELGLDPLLVEKNTQVGGTWFENRYPGAGVDTPSYLYSWSFFPRQWTTHFGKRDEVVAYVEDMATHFDLLRSIRFDTEVISAGFDDDAQEWTVTVRTASGTTETLTASIVITAVGLLSRPKVPQLPGMESFEGPLFHSACWPEDLDLRDKRVAVVGTGASAMQIVPAVVDEVAQLTIFQRSPQWAAPADNYFRPVSADVHYLMDTVPLYHQWYRFRLAWTWNDKVHASLEMDPEWTEPDHSLNAVNDGHRRFYTRYLTDQLSGREDLIGKALPGYPPFGKRMLLDNGWFEALTRDNVELITDPVTAITPTGVRSEGGYEREADIVVLCTGFDAQKMLYPMDITGREGVSLRELWGDDDPSAYLGLTTPGFPNLFFMYGPNSNSGAGGSYIFVAEAQARYIADVVSKMIDSGIGTVECRSDVHGEYNRRMDEAHRTRVWSHPGMQTYYRNARGRVVTNMPWRIVDYWDLTREASLGDFDTAPRRHDAIEATP
ncbi:MAG: NAD(P)/FAD-dependent oxidoreductase [Acidimicrobiales bacterium]